MRVINARINVEKEERPVRKLPESIGELVFLNTSHYSNTTPNSIIVHEVLFFGDDDLYQQLLRGAHFKVEVAVFGGAAIEDRVLIRIGYNEVHIAQLLLMANHQTILLAGIEGEHDLGLIAWLEACIVDETVSGILLKQWPAIRFDPTLALGERCRSTS